MLDGCVGGIAVIERGVEDEASLAAKMLSADAPSPFCQGLSQKKTARLPNPKRSNVPNIYIG